MNKREQARTLAREIKQIQSQAAELGSFQVSKAVELAKTAAQLQAELNLLVIDLTANEGA